MKALLVPVDFSATSEDALVHAIDLADELDAKIHLLHVIRIVDGALGAGLPVTSDRVTELIAHQQAALDRVARSHHGSGRIAGCWLRYGDAGAVIPDAATELAVDLIVIGTRGVRGIARTVLGSVVEAVMGAAACHVLLIRSQHGAPA